MAELLSAHRLTATYRGQTAPSLSSVDLRINRGEHVAVLGATGSGKTTLLQSIAGILQSEGHCRFEGQLTFDGGDVITSPGCVRFPATAYLPQDPSLVLSGFVATVHDELDLSLRQAGVPRETRERRIHEVAQQLRIERFLARDPFSLSGGESQLCALSALLVGRPQLLLLDEPGTALDSDTLGHLAQIIRGPLTGATVILADARISLPVLACSRCILMEHGTPMFDGTREEFWKRLPQFATIIDVGEWIGVHREHPAIGGHEWGRILEAAC